MDRRMSKDKTYKAILNKVFDALTEEEKERLMRLIKEFLKNSIKEKQEILDYIR